MNLTFDEQFLTREIRQQFQSRYPPCYKKNWLHFLKLSDRMNLIAELKFIKTLVVWGT